MKVFLHQPQSTMQPQISQIYIRCIESVSPAQGECSSDLQSAGWRASMRLHLDAAYLFTAAFVYSCCFVVNSLFGLSVLQTKYAATIVLPWSHINYVWYWYTDQYSIILYLTRYLQYNWYKILEKTYVNGFKCLKFHDTKCNNYSRYIRI